jgi:hypothetical protein
MKNLGFKYGYESREGLDDIKILDDLSEPEPIDPAKGFSLLDQSRAIVRMIRGSKQRFSVGIYSNWGTGKTTLMRIIEKDLHPVVFTWERTEDDNLKDFLCNHFSSYNLEWIRETDWKKHNDTYIEMKRPLKGKMNLIDLYKTKKMNTKVGIYLNQEKSIATLEINNSPVYNFSISENAIDKSIDIREDSILTIWFDAWRYEREEQFATIALMKTIAFAMEGHPLYEDIRLLILKGLTIITKDILRNVAMKYTMISEKGIVDLEKNFTQKLSKFAEIDKNTIYFNGLKKIEEKMEQILRKHSGSRIVVFIDDLDRCSPETALEVFESIKVFLDIRGFVFIIGLSQTVMNKIIAKKFDNFDINPEEYLRKIIQIELKIPKWQDASLKKLTNHLLDKIGPDIKGKLVKDEDDRELIQTILTGEKEGRKVNPREIKQYINSLVLLLSSHGERINSKHILVNEAFSTKWKDIHNSLSDREFKKQFEKYLHLNEKEKENMRMDAIEKENNIEIGYNKLTDFEKFLFEIHSDKELEDFLIKYHNILLEIQSEDDEGGWDKYETLKERSILNVSSPYGKDHLEFYTKLQEYLNKTLSLAREQSALRNKLYYSLIERIDASNLTSIEEMFEAHYGEMNKVELNIHKSMRKLTQNLNVYNNKVYNLLNENKKYFREIPELEDAYMHLQKWLNKYKQKIQNKKVSIVYFPEKPFPTRLHEIVDSKINELKYEILSKESSKIKSSSNVM